MSDLSYEFICYSTLIYEFGDSEKLETEKKIKGALNRNKKGRYVQERIDSLRELRDEICLELSNPERSFFYKKNPLKEFCDPTDFDFDAWLRRLISRHPEISNADMAGMLNISIYVRYLR